MARRSLHLAISALVLLALLLSARLSAPAVHASPLAGKLHISLKALYASPVFADINEPIKLAAIANQDTLAAGEYIVIGDWSGGKFSNREARCPARQSSCAANDPGGTEGSFLLKAAVVGPHNKILAKSSTLIIDRKPLSLALQITGPDGKPDSGTELGGTSVGMHITAPQGEGSSWSKVKLMARIGGATGNWIDFADCTIPCDDHPTTGGGTSSPQQVDYKAQVLDASGKVLKESNVVTITYRPWEITLLVNGSPITGDTATVRRQERAKISASVSDSLKIGNQQFHLIIREDSGSQALADCVKSPCEYTVDSPGTDCVADCPRTYVVLVQDSDYSVNNSNFNTRPITIRWHTSGYQFSGLSYHSEITDGPCPTGRQSCVVNNTRSDDITISGYVCGNPFSDTWKITTNYHRVITNTVNPQDAGTSDGSISNDKVTFDKTTGESNLTSGESDPTLYAFLLVFPFAAAPGKHTSLAPYVHFKLAGTPSADGTLTVATSAELHIHVPDDLVNYYMPDPRPGIYSGALYGGSGFDQDLSAPVTTKDDCP